MNKILRPSRAGSMMTSQVKNNELVLSSKTGLNSLNKTQVMLNVGEYENE
jgi:hypothetical protein